MEKQIFKRDYKVIRDKLKNSDRIPYARIPIINKYPLPMENEHPIKALYLFLRYIKFHLENQEKNNKHLIEISEKALKVFETFEVVDIEESIKTLGLE